MKMAKVTFEKFTAIPPKTIMQFIDYMLDFYGPTGPYADEMIFDEAEIRMGLYQRLMWRRDIDFEGDSRDREIVRDMILDTWAMRARRGVL
jgi:hypothetical protein